jgi:hypothetical protein
MLVRFTGFPSGLWVVRALQIVTASTTQDAGFANTFPESGNSGTPRACHGDVEQGYETALEAIEDAGGDAAAWLRAVTLARTVQTLPAAP